MRGEGRRADAIARNDTRARCLVSSSWLPIQPGCWISARVIISYARVVNIWARAWSLDLRARTSSICSENVPTRAPLISARVELKYARVESPNLLEVSLFLRKTYDRNVTPYFSLISLPFFSYLCVLVLSFKHMSGWVCQASIAENPSMLSETMNPHACYRDNGERAHIFLIEEVVGQA